MITAEQIDEMLDLGPNEYFDKLMEILELQHSSPDTALVLTTIFQAAYNYGKYKGTMQTTEDIREELIKSKGDFP